MKVETLTQRLGALVSAMHSVHRVPLQMGDFQPLLQPWEYEIPDQQPPNTIYPNGEGLGCIFILLLIPAQFGDLVLAPAVATWRAIFLIP